MSLDQIGDDAIISPTSIEIVIPKHFCPSIGDAITPVSLKEYFQPYGYLNCYHRAIKKWEVKKTDNCIEYLSPHELRHAVQSDRSKFTLFSNQFDPGWKKLLNINFNLRKAKSNRISCKCCDSTINKGIVTAGITRISWISSTKQLNNTTQWFHLECFPHEECYINIPSLFDDHNTCKDDIEAFRDANVLAKRSQFSTESKDLMNSSSHSSMQLPEPSFTPVIRSLFDAVEAEKDNNGISDRWPQFQLTCRNTVNTQIREFRDKFFYETSSSLSSSSSSKSAVCPISGKSINTTNSHVHHQFPLAFVDIVKLFSKLYPEIYEKAKISSCNEFVSYEVRKIFYTFHAEKARLIVVHADENLSSLKKKFDRGKCDKCENVGDLFYYKEWNLVMCFDCRYKTLIYCTEAKYLFRLKNSDLKCIDEIRRPNKVSKNFADHRIYLFTDVIKLAIENHGTLEAVINYLEEKIRLKTLLVKKISTRSKPLIEESTYSFRKDTTLKRIERQNLANHPKTLAKVRQHSEKKEYFNERRIKRYQKLLFLLKNSGI